MTHPAFFVRAPSAELEGEKTTKIK